MKEFISKVVYDKFHRPFFKVNFVDDDGYTITKTVDLQNYLRLLGSSYEEKKTYLKIPKLPEGVVDCRITDEDDTFKVILEAPSMERQFIYSPTKEILSVPYPRTLFFLGIKGGRVHYSYAFCVKKDAKIAKDTPLYLYPYGHVSREGSICMGNTIPKIDNIEDSTKFVENFFMSENLGHYYTEDFSTQKCSLRILLTKAMKKKKYPDSWLTPNGKTFGDIHLF